ncbi:MAG: acetyltransferase [Sedimentibacter saalensis]|uniref:acetyltransferase n=1 Tax=Sedimentibacter saalensis TaxID=130788 RepID=UPI002B201195|nr:acetyltransferase [Sedimentibacter saalensis]MEA5095144.1 acetyltransferase [Sedimentibacter saalensis]
MKQKNIVILGSSGFAKEVLWLIQENNRITNEWNIIGFIDNSHDVRSIAGYEVIGDDDWLLNYPEQIYVVCGIGNSKLKEKVVKKFVNKENVIFPSIISKGAVISDSVKMGIGCIICTNSILTVDITLGDFVTVNLDCTVGHDVILENFTTLYPSVNISGNVRIKSKTEIGTGSQVIQGLNIGENSIIGAGTVVIKDIPSYSTAVGNPARVIKQNK